MSMNMTNAKVAHINTVSIPLDKLIPHPKNPNTHPERQIKKLRHLIRVHGYSKGSVVFQASTHLILSGHGIITALKAEGYTYVDAIELDIDDAKAEAFMIADNKIADDAVIDNMALQNLISELSAMDVPSLDFAYDSSDLELLASQILADSGGYQAEPQDDEIPDVVEPITQSGDLWTLGKLQHRCFCGDSTKAEDVAMLMGGNKAELVFTSPPYSDMRQYGGDKDLSIDNLVEFIPCFDDYCNFMVINLGLKFEDCEVVEYWQAYIQKAKETGLKLLAWNVWDRKQAGSVAQASNMFYVTHEWLFIFGKSRKKLNRTIPNQMDKYKRRGGNGVLKTGMKTTHRQQDDSMKRLHMPAHTHHQLPSVFEQHAEQGPIRSEHPAIFPVGLPYGYIEAMTNEPDIVVDCFGGSGTTLIAAEKLNRQSFLMELSPLYCDVIAKRYIDFVGSSEGVFVDRQGQKIAYNDLNR